MALILSWRDEFEAARRVAGRLGWVHAEVSCHDFPDGETRLTLPAELPADVVLWRGLQQPNTRLAGLLLAAAGARELGVRRLTLVCPYLGYMRQDMAFAPGEVVSQRHIGRLLASHFDRVVTVDPHLHRIRSLDEIMPAGCGIALTAAAALGRFIAREVPGALIVGPDEESGPWAAAAALAAGLEHAVCHKERRGDRDVTVSVPSRPLAGRAVVLVDDVASTGRTLVSAAAGVLAGGAASVDVAVTHGLFVGDALAALREAGIRHVWCSDTVPHESSAISVGPLVAEALSGC